MSIDLYEILSDEIAEEVNEEVRNEVNLGDAIPEKEVDNMIYDKASAICPSNIDHYDVADKAKEKIDCWDAILPYGA